MMNYACGGMLVDGDVEVFLNPDPNRWALAGGPVQSEAVQP